MSTFGVDHRTIRGAIELATRAPSIHNTQPWRWYLADRGVHLFADRTRQLAATDPDGRDMVLSCGAALHHARLALASAGVRATIRRMPNSSNRAHLAAIEPRAGLPPETDAALAAVIPRRRSDRRPYRDWPVPTAFLRKLEEQAAAEGTVLRVVERARTRTQLLGAIREAAATHQENPDYQTELALWTARCASCDGVPAANLPSAPLADVPSGRRFATGDLGPLDGEEPDAAVLLVLGATSDDRLSQLRAGEALSAVLLTATELGLATCPLTEPVEVHSARRVLREDVLDGTMCPQVIIRLGWPPAGPALPPTPRRDAREVLRWLPR